MSRAELPNRRPSEILRFVLNGRRHFGSVSHFPDGRPAECFIDTAKPGSEAEINARDAAILVSLALQHGVPLQLMQHAVSRDDFGRAAGPIGAFLDEIAKLGPMPWAPWPPPPRAPAPPAAEPDRDLGSPDGSAA